MAASKAPGVILPTVPQMPSSGTATRASRSTSIKGGVVRVPKVDRMSGKVKGPKMPRPHKARMPKDANLLSVPAMKRIKGRPFSTKRKPVI